MRIPLSRASAAPWRIRAGTVIAVAASLAVAVMPATATGDQGPDVSAEGAEKGVITVQIENDILAGTDRHYTNGVRLSYTSPRLRQQIPLAVDALEWLYPFDAGTDARLRVSLGRACSRRTTSKSAN